MSSSWRGRGFPCFGSDRAPIRSTLLRVLIAYACLTAAAEAQTDCSTAGPGFAIEIPHHPLHVYFAQPAYCNAGMPGEFVADVMRRPVICWGKESQPVAERQCSEIAGSKTLPPACLRPYACEILAWAEGSGWWCSVVSGFGEHDGGSSATWWAGACAKGGRDDEADRVAAEAAALKRCGEAPFLKIGKTIRCSVEVSFETHEPFEAAPSNESTRSTGLVRSPDGTCDGAELNPGEKCCVDKDQPDFFMVCWGSRCPPLPNMRCDP